MSTGRQRSALVTGSSGFVGGHLVRRLAADGWSVSGLSLAPPAAAGEPSPDGVREHLGDIRDLEATRAIVAEAQPDVVFHLAAQASVPVSMRDPATDVLTNVLGSVHVAQAAAEAGRAAHRLLLQRGRAPRRAALAPANEDTPIAPDAVYGASKIAAEHELGALCRHLGLELSVLRPGNIYGPGQDAAGESGVVAIFSSRMLAGEPVTIFGDGSQQRDYVYVDDIVEAALLAAEREPATCVIGTGEGTATQRIFDTLAALTGYGQPPVYAAERPGDHAAIYLDPSRAGELWGWAPRTALEEGMARTVEWFRRQV